MLGHDDQQLGERSVRAPELGAVQDVVLSVLGQLDAGRQSSGVRAHLGLGERERADLTARTARQVLVLELVGPKELQRLRNTDRLVGGQQCGEVSVNTAQHLHDLRVFELVEAQTAVLSRNLHAEGAHLGELRDVVHVVLASRVHLDAVPGVPEEGLELVEEGFELRTPLGALRVGVDEVESEVAQEHFLHEAGIFPGGLARFLGDST